MSNERDKPRKGRGAGFNPDNRYQAHSREAFDDGWDSLEQPLPTLKTTLTRDTSKSVIAYNDSPDVPFDRSINPYRGCEHGCIYCFARPSHAWLGYSPGLDFESRLLYKPDGAVRLREELSKKNYQCQPISLGPNTDCYQPAERKQQIIRDILRELIETRHPVSIITKSALIERDIDLLQQLAADDLVHVMVSVTTLKPELARKMEPRAAAPHRRLETIKRLSEAGIPVGCLVAPVIPALTDDELETILTAVHKAGAEEVGYILLRLPREVAPLFEQWLDNHYPEKAARVLSLLKQSRGDKLYESRFGERMRGTGVFADLLSQRFRLARERLELKGLPDFRTDLFTKPLNPGDQLELI